MRIYEPTGRAREYSPLALNYFKGCTHNCRYCYVNRLNETARNGISQYMIHEVPDEMKFKVLEESAKKYQGCNKQILLCFTGDPYSESLQESTTKVLGILNKYEHKVSILTKGGNRVLNDIDLFNQFKSRDLFTESIPRIIVGASLTFDNDDDSLKWEPGAALPQERIESLRVLSEAGIKTWASFEPVIYPEQSLNLLHQVSPFVDYVKIGKVNDYSGWDKQIDWNDFIVRAVAICRQTGLKFYIKDDLAAFNRDTVFRDEERNSDLFCL
ncbi:radical SAM protein [Parabacteroides sp. FAFU027]|uniref:radical SAM protein n=1 Tax=Parabacteroides sp. FAFU027 TaxID=2922715 RepID=UPI001FAFA337|nr:radical SAM protein [Parabacteroides sp. FAFU027]